MNELIIIGGMIAIFVVYQMISSTSKKQAKEPTLLDSMRQKVSADVDNSVKQSQMAGVTNVLDWQEDLATHGTSDEVKAKLKAGNDLLAQMKA